MYFSPGLPKMTDSAVLCAVLCFVPWGNNVMTHLGSVLRGIHNNW